MLKARPALDRPAGAEVPTTAGRSSAQLVTRTAVAPQAMTVVVTTECNLRCGYCYLSRKGAGTISWPALRAALDFALQTGPPSLHVAFTGGEPLLHFPLIARAVRHVERVPESAPRVQYTIATNGTRLAPRVLAFLEQRRFQVSLGFDGVAGAQAARGRGTFGLLDRRLDRVRRDHWTLFDRRLNVAMTLTPATIPHLADSLHYFVRKGVKAINVSAAMKQPRWAAEDLDLLDREFGRVFESMLRRYEYTGEVPLVQFRKTSSGTTPPPGGDAWLCRAPSGQKIAIDVDGMAYGCLLATASYHDPPVAALRPALAALRLGRATDREFAERLAALPDAARACGLFQHPESRYSSYRRCGECEFLGRCHACPLAAAPGLASRDPRRVNDFVCAFNQVVLKYADRFPRQPDTYEIVTGRAPVPGVVRQLTGTQSG